MSDEKVVTPEEARAALQREKAARLAACREELQAVLRKHRCKLDVLVILRQGQVLPQVQVVAED